MKLLRSFAVAAAALAVLGQTAAVRAQVTLDPPTVSVVRVSRSSLVLQVEAGPSGAPAGFAVDWMKKADYLALGGWPANNYHPALFGCDFTGTPTLHESGSGTFMLGPSGAATVEMGDIFDETGLYANYYEELWEGTDYVVRARALGSPQGEESPPSATYEVSTLARTTGDCTLTQGFWKSHPETWSRVASMTLGSVSYTNAELQAILATPAAGNGLISLAHQLIAAKLNVLLGVTPPPVVAQAILDADALIGALVIPPVGAGYLAPGLTSALTETLDQFNNGTIGPGHCPDTGGIVPTRSQSWGSLKIRYR